jgi:hypothetical protein
MTAKAGKIVVFALVHPGHLGGFPANQRRPGLYAAFDDATDDGGGDVDVEAAGRVVIQEKQRFRSLYHHVIGAHRHQVDADCIMASGLDRKAQLGADAVGAGDQHWPPVASERQLDHGAKAADAGQHLGARAAPDQRLDALYQGIAGVDIDSGVTICIAVRLAHG